MNLERDAVAAMASTRPSESRRASRASFATASFNAGGVWEDKEEWGLSSENRAWLKDNNDSDGHGTRLCGSRWRGDAAIQDERTVNLISTQARTARRRRRARIME